MTQTSLVGSTFFGMDLSVLADRFWMFRRRVSKRVLLLEFGSASLTVAQARYGVDEVEFTHVRRGELPPGATERGVPTEPARMASLIQQICKEEKIYARRTAVVLPAKAAFHPIIQLPLGLTLDEARAYARNPSSGLQIPIPLQQTDFDLVPCSGQVNEATVEARQPYFLSSVPQKLVDQLLDTLQRADLEVLSIDLAFCCQLRLMAADAAALAPGEFLLLLECVRECSHLVVVANSGPVALFRLSAIREFPIPAFDSLKTEAAVQEALSAEAITLADDGYMPLSDLDLRVLVPEIQQIKEQFSAQIPVRCWKGVALTGVNSAHPGLADLLAEALALEVHVLRPLGTTGVGAVSFSSLLVHQSLGRLLGLGLGLLPHDALVACSLSPSADHHAFQALDPEPSPEPSPGSGAEGGVLDVSDPVRDLVSDAQHLLCDSPTQEEWPSIKSVEADALVSAAEEESVEKGEEDEEWPSLKLTLGVGEEVEAEAVVEERLEEPSGDDEGGEGMLGALRLSEEEWPSIKALEPGQVVVGMEDVLAQPSKNDDLAPARTKSQHASVLPSRPKNASSESVKSPSAAVLEEMNLKQLKELCRDFNITGYSRLRKDAIIKLIMNCKD